MAKADMLGASLWDAYSNKVTTLMNNPQHQGEIFEEEAESRGNKLIVADFGAESCGDAVRLYWEIDPKNDENEKSLVHVNKICSQGKRLSLEFYWFDKNFNFLCVERVCVCRRGKTQQTHQNVCARASL